MQTTEELLKQIKRSFRLYMNGVTAASMRQKGLLYKINWGVALMDLRRIAAEYGKNKSLAEALWGETTIRECRLLATLVMPPEEMNVDSAYGWAQSVQTIEEMEYAVFNLFQHLTDATQLVQLMLRSDDTLMRIGAYNLVSRLVKRDIVLPSDFIEEIRSRVNTDCNSENRQLLHALNNMEAALM